MKIVAASIALLGLPTALAAVAAPLRDSDNAIPAGPDAAHDLPRPSQESASNFDRKFNWKTEGDVLEEHHDVLKVQKREAAPPPVPPTTGTSGASFVNSMSSSTSASKGKGKTTTTKGKTSTITSSTAAAGATVTRLAVFTNAGLAWTITSASGVEAVDGFTLAPGSPVNVGGGMVSERPNGNVFLSGTKLDWDVYTAPSSSSSAAAAGGSSSGVGGLSSISVTPTKANGGPVATAGTSSSGGAAAPMRTAGVGAVGLVGAVIGAIVL